MDLIIQLGVAGLMLGTLYGLIGFTQTLMFRSTGVLSFAHAAFALVERTPTTGWCVIRRRRRSVRWRVTRFWRRGRRRSLRSW